MHGVFCKNPNDHGKGKTGAVKPYALLDEKVNGCLLD